MRKCNGCGMQVDEQTNFCPQCGSAEIVEEGTRTQQIEPAPNNDSGNGNILAGFVGALLFSIIGGALYFVIYQAGVIAGISGLVMFVLANFGYGLFAGTKNKASTAGLIASLVATVVMIYVSEYFCVSFEIYQFYKEADITIFDAIKATPEFMEDPALKEAVTKDLVYAYAFGLIAAISNIISIVKAKKQKQA